MVVVEVSEASVVVVLHGYSSSDHSSRRWPSKGWRTTRGDFGRPDLRANLKPPTRISSTQPTELCSFIKSQDRSGKFCATNISLK